MQRLKCIEIERIHIQFRAHVFIGKGNDKHHREGVDIKGFVGIGTIYRELMAALTFAKLFPS